MTVSFPRLALAGILALAARSQAIAQTAQTAPTAQPAAPGGDAPLISVSVGLQDLIEPAECVPVNVHLAGGGRAFSGTLLLRSGGQAKIIYELPVQAEAGSRRHLQAIACPPDHAFAWEWSVDGGRTWSAATPPARMTWLNQVAVVGERLGRLVALEEALNSVAVGTLPASEVATAVLPAADAPREAAGWSIADLVLVDAMEVPALDPAALAALRDHLLVGGAVVVAGAELGGVPPSLLAGELEGPSQAVIGPPDAPVTVATATLRALPGGESPAVGGAAQPWVVARRVGAGKLVTVGLDLTEATVREALDAAAWREILGISPTGGWNWAHRSPSPFTSAFDGTAQQRCADSARSTSLLPPMASSIYLVVAGAVTALGLFVLGRRTPGGASARDIGVLLAAVAIPAFVAGAFGVSSRTPETWTIVEHWEAERRSLVVTWTPIGKRARAQLPAGAHVPSSVSALRPAGQLAGGVRLGIGPNPAVTVDGGDRMGTVVVRTERWRDEPEAVRARLLADDPPRVAVGAGGLGAHEGRGRTAVEDALLQQLAGMLRLASGEEGLILLDRSESQGGRTIWLLRSSPVVGAP